MGFASIGAFIMLFFSLIIIISAFALLHGKMVESTQLALQTEQQRIEQTTKTTMSITTITFDNLTAPDSTVITLNNSGQNKIDLAYLDVFIDHVRVPRSVANRTIAIIGQNAVNPLHWDPGETLQIEVGLNLAAGSHRAVVSTEYGIEVVAPFTT